MFRRLAPHQNWSDRGALILTVRSAPSSPDSRTMISQLVSIVDSRPFGAPTSSTSKQEHDNLAGSRQERKCVKIVSLHLQPRPRLSGNLLPSLHRNRVSVESDPKIALLCVDKPLSYARYVAARVPSVWSS